MSHKPVGLAVGELLTCDDVTVDGVIIDGSGGRKDVVVSAVDILEGEFVGDKVSVGMIDDTAVSDTRMDDEGGSKVDAIIEGCGTGVLIDLSLTIIEK